MRVCILGHAGYVGSKLVPTLLAHGHHVHGIDLNWLESGKCFQTKADIRDMDAVNETMANCDAVIHLACISNDPASELNPKLTKSINLDSFLPIVEAAKSAGVKRFIFASSSSVYGVRPEKDIVETTPLTPLTDYSRYKAECEKILLDNKGDMEAVVVRPATVCGMSPNLRLDLAVHILTISALRYGIIQVFGGSQYRPNIYIDDLCDAYELLLVADNVDGEIFNVGHQNLTITETAEMVRNVVGEHVEIVVSPSSDPRSYHVSSQKIAKKLGFTAYQPIGRAIVELKDAWDNGEINNPDDARYHRIRGMREMFHV